MEIGEIKWEDWSPGVRLSWLNSMGQMQYGLMTIPVSNSSPVVAGQMVQVWARDHYGVSYLTFGMCAANGVVYMNDTANVMFFPLTRAAVPFEIVRRDASPIPYTYFAVGQSDGSWADLIY